MKKNKKISIDQIIAFTKVATEGSIKNAAKLVKLSPSAVSTAMIGFEEAIGEKLFIRHQNGLYLTPQGQRLNKHCVKLVNDFESIKDEFSFPKEVSGEIRISTWHGIASFVLCNSFVKFVKERNNQILLDIIGDNRHLRFEDYNCDVAIRPFYTKRPDLIQIKLFSMQFRAFATAKYLNEYGHPQCFDDLDAHQLLSTSFIGAEEIPFSDWHLFEGKKVGEMRRPFLSFNSSIGLATCCAEGLGIATFPSYYRKYVNVELIDVFPDFNPPLFEIYFTYPKISEGSKRICLLRDFLLEQFQEKLWT
ncbi:MAG: LysR family transcriptional regulator [Candidatus Levybacteria bacterium]|jgi:DNA-binding transcriptional LysR family regulator|nr:LysR family transcriptional regulator [Candidatus Levybacteria bacterium]